MGRRQVIRIGFSLLLCAFVGLGLMVSADGARWTKPEVTVVTRSAGALEGRLRATSQEGVELLVADQRVVIPWNAVVEMSLRDTAASASAGEGAAPAGRI